MSRIVKTAAIALAIVAVLVAAFAGSALAAGSGTGPGDCTDCQQCQYQKGIDNAQGHGEPGDGLGPGLENHYGQP